MTSNPPFIFARDERGFTLIELLVSLALLAIMTTMLFGSFRFGARAWEVTGTSIDEVNRIQAVQSLLRGELSQALLSPLVNAPPNETALPPTFLGEKAEIRFLAPLPAHQGIGGLYLFRLRPDRRDSSTALILEWHVYRPDVSVVADAKPEGSALLLTDISSLSIAYFGRASADAPPAWVQQWNDRRRLPELIRLEIQFPQRDRRYWPALVIAPLVTGSVIGDEGAAAP